MNRQKAHVDPILLNLAQESELSSESCSKMAVGIIKHILYHREQIPEPFDQLVKLCTNSNSTTERVKTFSDARMKLRQNQISLITKIFIDLFSNLEKVFQCFENTRIRRIAVLLGATIATPKEVHFIDLPRRLLMKQENGAVSNPFASDRSLTQMFRTLFIKSSCKTWPCISPTNITVLLLMRRDCKSEWFLPKTCYVLPHCNNEVIYRLTHSLNTSLGTPINDLKSRGRYTCMCPFDVYESPMTGPQNCKAGQLPPNNCASVPTSGVYKQKMDVGSDTEEDDDLIWFQMPVSAKGILNL